MKIVTPCFNRPSILCKSLVGVCSVYKKKSLPKSGCLISIHYTSIILFKISIIYLHHTPNWLLVKIIQYSICFIEIPQACTSLVEYLLVLLEYVDVFSDPFKTYRFSLILAYKHARTMVELNMILCFCSRNLYYPCKFHEGVWNHPAKLELQELPSSHICSFCYLKNKPAETNLNINKLILQYLKTRRCEYYSLYNHYI